MSKIDGWPHNTESERALLACALNEPMVVMPEMARHEFEPETFMVELHRQLWEGMKSLYDRGKLIDIVSLGNELVSLEYPVDVIQLGQVAETALSTWENYGQYLRDVKAHWRHRQMIKAQMKLRECLEQHMVYEERLEQVRLIGTEVNELTMVESEKGMLDVSGENLERMKQIRDGTLPPFSERTIYWPDDAWNEEFRPLDPVGVDNLQVICASSGEGKSSFARQMVYHNLKLGRRIVIFQLEGERDEVLNTIASQESGCGIDDYLEGRAPEDLMDAFEGVLMDLQDRIVNHQLFVYEEERTIEGITSRSRQIAATYGRVDCIVIDYLQLVETNTGRLKDFGNSMEAYVAHVSTKTYHLAKELDTILLCLAQMNRNYERDADRADAAWMRNSSRIVHDATGVLMFAWPSVYKTPLKDEETGLQVRDKRGKKQWVEHEIGDDVEKRYIKAFQIKRRNGRKKMVPMMFWGTCTKFEPGVDSEHRGRPKGARDSKPRAKKKTKADLERQFAELSKRTKTDMEDGTQWTQA